MIKVEYQLPHITLRGVKQGDSNLPVLLCLHGWLDNAASFFLLQPYLKHYQIVMVDLPGHGLSDHKSEDAYYHFVDWLHDLHCLFAVTGWQQVHLLGHSMGAMIATAYAATFPEKILSITLIDALGFITTEERQTVEQLRLGLTSRAEFYNKPRKYRSPVYASVSDAINARVRHSDLTFALAEHIVRRNIKRLHQGYQWRYDQRLRLTSPQRFTPEQAFNIFASLAVPCLFIAREQQTIKNDKTLRTQALNLIDNITCDYLTGGHHLHMEQPELIAEKIASFHASL